MIILDYKDRRPIYQQIVEQISGLILNGILKPDEKMPSVRSLAMDLSINPNTIQRAYTELEREGFLYSVKGRGNFVSYSMELLEQRKIETLKEVRTVLEKAKNNQIEQEEIRALLENVYQGGKNHD